MVPRSSTLTLDRTGFGARHLFLTRRWDWDEVTHFYVRHIIYPRAGGIDLVGFQTKNPSEREGDFLQELGVRWLTRTTTVPDRYGAAPERLADLMLECRARFADGQLPARGDSPAEVVRSRVLNGIALGAMSVLPPLQRSTRGLKSRRRRGSAA